MAKVKVIGGQGHLQNSRQMNLGKIFIDFANIERKQHKAPKIEKNSQLNS